MASLDERRWEGDAAGRRGEEEVRARHILLESELDARAVLPRRSVEAAGETAVEGVEQCGERQPPASGSGRISTASHGDRGERRRERPVGEEVPHVHVVNRRSHDPLRALLPNTSWSRCQVRTMRGRNRSGWTRLIIT